jgi:hypothetical protein
MFVPGKPFQPSIVFVDKARSLPYRGAPERCITWVGCGGVRQLYISIDQLPVLIIYYVHHESRLYYNSALTLVLTITIINVMPQFAASLIDNSRVIIYFHNMFITQATGDLYYKTFYNRTLRIFVIS